MSMALARRWKKSLPERRIGVILPPGTAGTLANVGLLFAGKVPVNLNPTLSELAARACLEQAGIQTILTAAPIEAKCTKFPWTPRVLHIESEIGSISGAQKLWHLAAAFLLPTSLLSRLTGLTKTDPDAEAALLFTSGSSGLPKGVPLTHRNLVTNILQVSETGFVEKDDRLLTALPLFHSFGLTMGLFFPLVTRRAIVTAPSPLDCDKLAEAARADAPTVLLATPTFLRQYLKRVPRDAFGTLRRVVSGAEKLPADLRVAFRARFGCEILEGYGLTEASPVVSLNLPRPGLGRRSGRHPAGISGGQRWTPPSRCRRVPPRPGNPGGNTGRTARTARTPRRQPRRRLPWRTGCGKIPRRMVHYRRYRSDR